MPFGGTIKLTGESEYRSAIQQITQDLGKMSSALKAQATDFGSSDKSMKDSAQKQKELTETLKAQQTALLKAKSSYAEYSVAVQAQTAKHNALSKEYKNAVLELERIKKASGESSEEYKKQEKVVDELGEELAESTEELYESKAAMSALKSEMNNSQRVIDNTTKEIDELGKETEETGEQAEKAGEGFTVFKAVLANLATQAINSALNGLKKLGAAVVDVGKQAYGSYASYEQLAGGVETLFGDSSDELMRYARSAYKTAGLSANQYMEQATSFSASLLQGLGGDTAAAVEYANKAIIDMSDNANKMGTDIASIQNAYQGFAKQNYTMLDNLRLGYGGSASEMARLINDSGVLKNVTSDQSKEAEKLRANLEELQDNYASYAVEVDAQTVRHNQLKKEYRDAIKELDKIGASSGETSKKYQNQADVVAELGEKLAVSSQSMDASKAKMKRMQTEISDTTKAIDGIGTTTQVTAETVKDVPFDKIIEAIHKTQQEIGITGTTSAEAASTIEGSAASMRAAWENLLVGIADENQDITPLLGNLVDQVITAGKNMIPRVKQIISGIMETVSEIWNEVIPELAKQIPELQPIVDAMNWVKENADYIIAGLAGIVAGFAAFKVAGAITSIIQGFSSFFGIIKSGQGIMAGLNLVMSANPIGIVVAAVAGLTAAFAILWNTSEDFRNFWIGLWENIKSVFGVVWEAILGFFTETIPTAFNGVMEKIRGWKDNIVGFFQELPAKASQVVQAMISFFSDLPYNLGYILGTAIGHLIKWGQGAWKWVTTMVPQIITGIVNFFQQLPGRIWTWLQNALAKVVTWGASVRAKAFETGQNFLNSLISFFQQLPGKIWSFLSNAILKVSQFSVNIANKAREGATNMYNNIVNGIKGLPSRIKSIGSDIVKGLWNGINGMKDWVVGKIKGFASGLVDGIKGVLGISSPSKVFRDEVGENIAKGIGVGFTDEMKKVSAQMQDAIPTGFDTDANINGVSGSRLASGSRGYVDMVSAFKEALSQMKIELDDDEVGRFIDKTVTRLVYN